MIWCFEFIKCVPNVDNHNIQREEIHIAKPQIEFSFQILTRPVSL